VKKGGRRSYTEAEDARIERAGADELRELSELWKVNFATLTQRRGALRRGELHVAQQPPASRGEQRVVGPRFARPSWFEEDLRQMTRGAV
jgi:hypothetical protein